MITNQEIVQRLLLRFMIIDGKVYWPFREDVSVGDVDKELELAMIERMKGRR